MMMASLVSKPYTPHALKQNFRLLKVLFLRVSWIWRLLLEPPVLAAFKKVSFARLLPEESCVDVTGQAGPVRRNPPRRPLHPHVVDHVVVLPAEGEGAGVGLQDGVHARADRAVVPHRRPGRLVDIFKRYIKT